MAHLCYLSFVYYPHDCNVFSVERLLFNLCSDFFTMHGEGKKSFNISNTFKKPYPQNREKQKRGIQEVFH